MFADRKASKPPRRATCFVSSSLATALKYLHFLTVYSARDLEHGPTTASTKIFMRAPSPSTASPVSAYLAISLDEAFSSSISRREMTSFCSGVKHISDSFSVTSSSSSAWDLRGESAASLSFFFFFFPSLSLCFFLPLVLDFSSASSCSPSSSLSLSWRLILSTVFFFALLFLGGFLMMKVLSLCLGSTSDTWPQALHVRVMFPLLSTSMTVSGLPQA